MTISAPVFFVKTPELFVDFLKTVATGDKDKLNAFFAAHEFKERLAKGPVLFDLVAIMGKQGDQTSDPSLRWDDENNRPTTPLGKISIEAIVPEATCDAGTFLPGECHGRSRWTNR